MAKPENLPDWPRGLPLDWAAVYVGLSPNTFLRLVDGKDEKGATLPPAKTAPTPLYYPGRRKVWLREELDAWIDRLRGKAPTSGRTERWPVDGENNAPLR